MSLLCEVSGMSLSVSGKTLLDNIELSLEEGSLLALVGESGAGKTLLSAAMGIVSLFWTPYNPVNYISPHILQGSAICL